MIGSPGTNSLFDICIQHNIKQTKQDKGMIGSPEIPETPTTAKKSKTRILPRNFFRHFLKDQKIGSYGKNQENL